MHSAYSNKEKVEMALTDARKRINELEEQFNNFGTIRPKSTLFLRMSCGKAENPETGEFELSTNVGGGNPIVLSKKTGKWFTMSWEDMINLAIARGILTEDTDGKEAGQGG
jgi:hypothetical protein